MCMCNFILFFASDKVLLFQYFLFNMDSSIIVLFIQEREIILIIFQTIFAFKAAHQRISVNA